MNGTSDETEMKLKARRVLRALDNMREGRWRYMMMPPQDRLDAAWLVGRYNALRGKMLFSEASMQASIEFLLMVIRGDEWVLQTWAEASPIAWCPQCQVYRLTTDGDIKRENGAAMFTCRECGRELVAADLEEEWAEHKGDVMYKLRCGAIDLPAAAAQLAVDNETLREWSLDEYFYSRLDQPTACRILGLTAEELIATRFKVLVPAIAVDDLPPIDRGEALRTLRRVARIEE